MDRNNNKILSTEFTAKLAGFSAGYLTSGEFDKAIRVFEDEISGRFFSYSCESNLLRIIQAMYDKPTLLSECVKYKHYAEILTAVCINSNYLTDILVRNPEYFYWIVNPSVIESRIERVKFSSSVRKAVSVYKSFSSKVNALRRLKRKEILRIGMKDILGKAELNEITGELTVLAQSVSAELFSLCYEETLLKHGIKNLSRKYCLIALGKLGGGELNYSSDIDLVIFYDKNSLIKNKKYYNELLTEAVYLFIKSASSITENGFLYRVDFRLRPDGRNSPLCRSITEYLNYYESRGEDWERQMLIKAGFVAGSKSLFESFMNYLKPFIYPAAFISSPTEQIKKLKNNIENRLKDEANIKLIPGGIRDIEFAVQALQLLNGGKSPDLRTGSTLEAIFKLSAAGYLSLKENDALKNAYILYRRIEHYLQLMNDAQTHTIPGEGELLERLSAFLGFKDADSFKKAVDESRNAVKKISDSILNVKYDGKEIEVPEIVFSNVSLAQKNLQFLKEGKGLLGQKQFDTASINLFQNIEESLYSRLLNSRNPDMILQNFARVIKSISLPSIWYREFADDTLFKKFLFLCEYSQKAIDIFAEDDDLREFFITRKVFEPITKKAMHAFDTKKFLFTLTVQFALDMIPALRLSEMLSLFISEMISRISESFAEEKMYREDYAIAAMGSFGSGDVTFASDIDLIFIVNDLNSYPEIQKDFQQLLLKLKEALKPFDVDCRLRPEGKNSILVWDLISYRNYILKRARIWELQSFCKLRFVSGNRKVFSRLSGAIIERIRTESKLFIKSEILGMRKKLYMHDIAGTSKLFNLKKSRGGLADIEFVLQFLILTNDSLFSKCRGKSTVKISGILASLLPGADNFIRLRLNFIFLKRLAFTIQSTFNSSAELVLLNGERLTEISFLMGFKSADEFKEELSGIINSNQIIFNKYLS